MKKGKSFLQKSETVLLSCAVMMGMVFGGAMPTVALAQENAGIEDTGNSGTVSGNEAEVSGPEISEKQDDEPATNNALNENTVSGNEVTGPEEILLYNAEDIIASGTDWELTGDGTLTIVSDIGMSDWKDNGWDNNKLIVKNVVIEEGVTEIVREAFDKCSAMISVTMPNSVTIMQGSAFRRCSSLKTIIFSENLDVISSSAFWGCESLQYIKIPEGVKRIGLGAFGVCKGLELVILPESLKEIGFSAFANCPKLNIVIMLSDPPSVDSDVFNTCGFKTNGVQGIIVPYDKAEDYKQRWEGDMNAQGLVQYIKAHIHSWETAWTSNAVSHWHDCTVECTTINVEGKDGYAVHVENTGVVTKQPTQTEAGIMTYACRICGYEMREESIAAAGTGGGNSVADRKDKDSTGDDGSYISTESFGDITADVIDLNLEAGNGINGADPGEQSKDHEPQTGDSTPLELYATLAMVMGLVYLLLYFTDRRHGMTENKKKELISGLIEWARQGGTFKRLTAITVIFILLVYYHGIGKQIALEWKEVYEE